MKSPHHKGPRPPLVRFWEKVDLSAGLNGCWPWLAAIGSDGYGVFWLGNRQVTAHAGAYILIRGPVPAGLVVDHLCDNSDPSCSGGSACVHRRCVNPRHLEPVANGTNVLRGRTSSALNARKRACLRGHPLAGDNLAVLPNGDRRCRTCHAAAARRSRASLASRLRSAVA